MGGAASVEGDYMTFRTDCLVGRGEALYAERRFPEAEACLREAIALDPQSAVPHYHLGRVRQIADDPQGAIRSYRTALEHDPSLLLARQKLALLFSTLGRFNEALPLWQAIAATNPRDLSSLNNTIDAALCINNTSIAAEYANRTAALKRGSRYYRFPGADANPPAVLSPAPELSVSKLRHDIEQFGYLREKGILADEIVDIIEKHKRVLRDLLFKGVGRAPLGEEERQLIGDVYGRVVHVRPTPHVEETALSKSWNAADIEDSCTRHPQGVAIVDDFLSLAALDALRLFCLESTVWNTNRYMHGRLGAFFREGFNCPLLVQIADELRGALPRLIGNKRLEQLWAFKYGNQPTTPAHADFAAVNVNFWLTSDEANEDRDSGGLVYYNIEAPLSWDFARFNKDGDKISAFLKENKARPTTIPYRANRAIIFKSDVFHRTSAVKFLPGYNNKRINVTILYGRREHRG
jgi:hypothetical protein